MGPLESIRYEIMTGDIDFSEYTANHLEKLKEKQEAVDAFLQEMNP